MTRYNFTVAAELRPGDHITVINVTQVVPGD